MKWNNGHAVVSFCNAGCFLSDGNSFDVNTQTIEILLSMLRFYRFCHVTVLYSPIKASISRAYATTHLALAADRFDAPVQSVVFQIEFNLLPFINAIESK